MLTGPLNNLKKLATLILVIGTVSRVSHAEPPPALWDPILDPGFQHFYNLEYEDALRIFRARVAANPNDPIAYTNLAQTVLYAEMFRNRALDSDLIGSSNPFVTRPQLKVTAEHQREFKSSLDRAIELCQKKLEGGTRDQGAKPPLDEIGRLDEAAHDQHGGIHVVGKSQPEEIAAAGNVIADGGQVLAERGVHDGNPTGVRLAKEVKVVVK